MQFIDSHTHVHFDNFAGREAEVLDSADKAGVIKTVNVGVNISDSKKAINLAAKYENAFASAGVHPHEAKDFTEEQAEQLEQLLRLPKVVAVGEIGLDYFKLYSSRQQQTEALSRQIEIGLKAGLPFIFHVRDAWNDFFQTINAYQNITGVVHSFSADPSQLGKILTRGFYVGLNGIMTFTRDHLQLEAAKKVPLEKLLLETDAPFLAPAPKRGQTCEPKDLVLTAKFLAELRGESLSELAKASYANTEKLFKLS